MSTLSWTDAHRRAAQFTTAPLTTAPVTTEPAIRLGWSLLLLAAAHDTDQPVDRVTLEQLRYRIEQPRSGAERSFPHDPANRHRPYITWLHARLRAMGYVVAMPELPTDPLLALRRNVPPLTDRSTPVGAAWHYLASYVPYADLLDYSHVPAASVLRTRSPMWDVRNLIRAGLDRRLLADRQSWPTGTIARVASRPELGAVRLHSPIWQWDYEKLSVHDGLPAGYLVYPLTAPVLTHPSEFGLERISTRDIVDLDGTH